MRAIGPRNIRHVHFYPRSPRRGIHQGDFSHGPLEFCTPSEVDYWLTDTIGHFSIRSWLQEVAATHYQEPRHSSAKSLARGPAQLFDNVTVRRDDVFAAFGNAADLNNGHPSSLPDRRGGPHADVLMLSNLTDQKSKTDRCWAQWLGWKINRAEADANVAALKASPLRRRRSPYQPVAPGFKELTPFWPGA
jgi:hypothetical protein